MPLDDAIVDAAAAAPLLLVTNDGWCSTRAALPEDGDCNDGATLGGTASAVSADRMPTLSGAVMSVRMCCSARWKRNTDAAGVYAISVWSTSKPTQWKAERLNGPLWW